MDAPETEIRRGSPSPEEEAAIREAILRVWREERAEAVRDSGMTRWQAAARAEATGNGAADLGRGPDAWRLSMRVAGFGMISVLRTGRGDSR